MCRGRHDHTIDAKGRLSIPRTLLPGYQLASEDPRNAESSFGVNRVILSAAKHRLINASLFQSAIMTAINWPGVLERDLKTDVPPT